MQKKENITYASLVVGGSTGGLGGGGGNFGPASAGVRDSRSVNRYLPWLSAPPANTAAQGPREFLDCVAHIRLLSWLLLGSVNHTLRYGDAPASTATASNAASNMLVSQPIPLDASCHIADHIQVGLKNKNFN